MSISPVYINGFHQATDHPRPQKNHMVAENNNSNKKPSSKDKCFQRMCIFCLHSKWRLEKDNRHFQFYLHPNQNDHFVLLPPPCYPRRLNQEWCCGQRNSMIEQGPYRTCSAPCWENSIPGSQILPFPHSRQILCC